MTDIFTTEIDSDGVCWAAMDMPGRSANVLDDAVLRDFEALIEKLEADTPEGLILYSKKDGGFMAGADVEMLDAMSADEIRAMIEHGKDLLERLEDLECPTVAMVHGHCLGGGLEVALACDHRVARDDAQLGLPEVKLGLAPGLGGTYRLPSLVGAIDGMSLIIAGKSVDAKKAAKMGLVDEAVPARHWRTAAKAQLGETREEPKGLEALKRDALDTGPARGFAANQMRKKTREKVREEHYPAPFRLIDLFEEHGLSQELMDAETELFAELTGSIASRNLRRVFLLQEKKKREARLPDDELEIQRVHVIGAGAMGGDIAAWAALKGFEVTVTDVQLQPIADAVRDANRLFDKKTAKNRGDIRPPRNRFIPDPHGHGVARADLIIEAAPEKLDLKEQLFEELEPKMKPDAIIATNTSSLKLKDLASALKKPGRLVGLHFFNPVSKMPLVEVVRHGRTSKRALAQSAAFAETIDKLPVTCKDAAGFIVNRALTPYLLEAARLMEEGVKPELIDAAAEKFGMAQGPVEVADHVGLDIALDVAEHLKDDFPEEIGEIPKNVKRTLEQRGAGVKDGCGFYEYEDGEAQKSKVSDADMDGERIDPVCDRLILPLLNVCAQILHEGVADSEEDVDAALIFGAGFAPFRGGPFGYARYRQIDAVVADLERLEKKHGERFAPSEGWSILRT
ncbi:MAG: 3-hydroxyacyl-CoA dehydrogenase NAD-binding domain-containing protein [Oceanicaulis sp.]